MARAVNLVDLQNECEGCGCLIVPPNTRCKRCAIVGDPDMRKHVNEFLRDVLWKERGIDIELWKDEARAQRRLCSRWRIVAQITTALNVFFITRIILYWSLGK